MREWIDLFQDQDGVEIAVNGSTLMGNGKVKEKVIGPCGCATIPTTLWRSCYCIPMVEWRDKIATAIRSNCAKAVGGCKAPAAWFGG